MKLHLDFETRSEAVLDNVGAIAYAMHPSTEVLCMGFAFDDEPVRVMTNADLRRTNNFFPDRLNRQDLVIGAHNAPFEDAIWHYVMHKKYGYPEMRDPRRWDCTMARALMVGLPAKLGQAAKVLGLRFQKDLEGRKAMIQLSCPAGRDVLGDVYYNEDPALYAKLYPYCGNDVELERAADKVLPEMLPHERAIWEQDLIMNRRGVAVDLELSRKASRIAGVLTSGLNAQLRDLTGGYIDKATQFARMKAWLVKQGFPEYTPSAPDAVGDRSGIDGESLDKAAILALLERKDLTPLVREVLTIRQQVGKSSTAKYTKTVEAACPDGRVRGVLQYHAAHTGREGGRLIQPQNYPKGWMDDPQKGIVGAVEQQKAIDAIMADDAGMFDVIYGKGGMNALSDTLRGTIIAGPGKILVSADYSSIELCVEMWLAGDEVTLNLLRKGGKPYVEMAQLIYNNPAITKTSHPKEYDLGKRTVLGGGFGMGRVKFKLTCKTQANLDISDELSDLAIKTYRRKYPLIVELWADIETAAISAVKNPGQAYAAGARGQMLWVMSKDRRFLVCRLPSGRFLWYWKPFVRMGKTPWGEVKEEMCYWGKHPKTGQWVVIKTYGGLLTENPTQAIARDFMMHGLINCEKAGYEMLLTVHDELLGETEFNSFPGPGNHDGAFKDFLKIMCKTPAWGDGCPISAEGWVGHRYRK